MKEKTCPVGEKRPPLDILELPLNNVASGLSACDCYRQIFGDVGIRNARYHPWVMHVYSL